MASQHLLEHFKKNLGHEFTQPEVLLQALTHRSFSRVNNERLEFLGDAALDLAISALLCQHFDQAQEGELSRWRAQLVCEPTLHRLAVQLQLSTLLRLSEGEARSGGAQRPSILADAFEAIIGAVFLESGFMAVQQVVHRLFAPLLLEPGSAASEKDPKTTLQEALQARQLPRPVYSIEHVEGQAHAQTFTVRCSTSSPLLSATGQGKSRRLAEQEAAKVLLPQVLSACPPKGKM